MRVWVEFFDASGNKLGPGPVVVKSASVTRVLDGIGSITFDVPATDARARELVQSRRRIKLYCDYDGTPTLLGEGVILRKERSHDSGGWALRVDCADIMQELKDANTSLARVYDQQNVSAVVDSLVALAPGWAANIYDEDTLFEGRFDGVSALKALQGICKNLGLHMRLEDASRRLGFGAFGEDIGLTLINADSPMARGKHIAVIESMNLLEESEDIVNWIQPVGAGEGEAALTLKNSTREFVSSETINGRLVYYVTDEASVAAYGSVQKVVAFKDIAPIANSAAAKVNAANALADATYVELTRRAAPYKTLSVNLQGTDRVLRAGDKVRVLYLGAVRQPDGSTLDDDRIDGLFWVTKVKERYNADGRSIALEVSEIDELTLDEAAVVMNAVEDMKLRSLKPQTYPYWSENTYIDTVAAGNIPASSIPMDKDAVFKLRFDSSVTDVTSVQIEFKTKPVYVLGYTFTFVPGVTYESIFSLVEDDDHPIDVHLWVNGVDVSADYGGPWNVPPDEDRSLETLVNADITQLILDAGIYQDHEIKVTCGIAPFSTSYWAMGMPGGLNNVNSTGSGGIVEMNIRILGVAQAILPAT